MTCFLLLAAIFLCPLMLPATMLVPPTLRSIRAHGFRGTAAHATAKVLGPIVEALVNLEPLSFRWHLVTICAIPVVWGFAIWLNFLP